MNIASLLASKGSRVITIQSTESVRYAVELLAEHNIGALVVQDRAGNVVGIVSERDIVRAAAKNEQIFAEPISAIMTRHLVIGVPHDDLASVGHTMTERRIRHLPVMENRQLIGIISIGDIVKAQRDQYEGEVETLQTQLLGEQQ